MFPHQNPVCTPPLSHTCHTPSPSHPFLFDHPNNIRTSEQIKKLSVTSSSLDSNILLSTLFLNILSLLSVYLNLYLVLKSLLKFYLAKMKGTIRKYDIHAKNRRLVFHDTQGRAVRCLSSTRLIMSGVHKLKEPYGRSLHEKSLRHKQRRLTWVM